MYEYLGADFVFGQPKTRAALIGILLNEQRGRCCYCMRRIDRLASDERTIEHVIVNHPKDSDDYNQYLGKNSQLDTADIISSADFLARQMPPPPYPHSVAIREYVDIVCRSLSFRGRNIVYLQWSSWA